MTFFFPLGNLKAIHILVLIIGLLVCDLAVCPSWQFSLDLFTLKCWILFFTYWCRPQHRRAWPCMPLPLQFFLNLKWIVGIIHLQLDLHSSSMRLAAIIFLLTDQSACWLNYWLTGYSFRYLVTYRTAIKSLVLGWNLSPVVFYH